MELMQLEMFVAMVEEGNFNRAAERVSRTQPAVSMALRKLEEEIGAPLFDRSNRSAYALTDTGELLYKNARRMLALRDETMAAVERLRTVQTGSIRIGANESATLYLVPRLIQAFHRQHPRVEVEVVRHPSARLIGKLRRREVDFGILAFRPKDDDLETVPLMRDEMVLIASPEHRLCASERVRSNDLAIESVIALKVRDASGRKVLEGFERFRTPLNVTLKVDTIEAVKKLVAMNLGIALVPLMCVHEEVSRGELVVLALEGKKNERTLWMARRRTDAHSHAACAFIRVAATVAGELATLRAESEPSNELGAASGSSAKILKLSSRRTRGQFARR
ncbi:MAG: LysR family transcriptional regulator [Acidobacteria bacterium]|nr:MAG: LysR family transcriptional regulator [Acidobacteriota bacterium]